MRAIVLNTAAIDNGGTRHEAGSELKVGTGKGEIREERVSQLLARNLCAETAKPVAKAAGSDKAAPAA